MKFERLVADALQVPFRGWDWGVFDGRLVETPPFRDVGAIVLLCRITPWQVPGFSVVDDEPALRDLHRHIRRHGAWRVHTHRFLIEARRPT